MRETGAMGEIDQSTQKMPFAPQKFADKLHTFLQLIAR
jgi:hypothetical protein